MAGAPAAHAAATGELPTHHCRLEGTCCRLLLLLRRRGCSHIIRWWMDIGGGVRAQLLILLGYGRAAAILLRVAVARLPCRTPVWTRKRSRICAVHRGVGPRWSLCTWRDEASVGAGGARSCRRHWVHRHLDHEVRLLCRILEVRRLG